MSNKLNIASEMAALDSKDRAWYDELTDEERKKFSNFLMIRWSSAVGGDTELQQYYVQSCNHYLNKHIFDINKHPKLQWLCCTAVSPGMGNHRHNWIAPKKKDKGNSANKKQLMELFPSMKADDINTMAALVDKKEIAAYLKDHGVTK